MASASDEDKPDAKVTLEMVLAHQKRMLTEIRAMRDDLLVQGARIERIDGSLQSLIGELRGVHRIQARTIARVRALEETLLPAEES
jgi:hypothetical protein